MQFKKFIDKKKTMEQFKSEMEYFDKNFRIFVPSMFSPPKDIFIIAMNDNGIKRYMSLYDKATGVYELNSIEEENGNLNTNKTTDNKSYSEVYNYYYDKFDNVLYPDDDGGYACEGGEGEAEAEAC